MNYYNLIIKELKSQINYLNKYLKECEKDEEDNIVTNIIAIEYCINYFYTRFSNNLKYYNNDETKAYDLYSAKKALEYLNIYTEEFFFLDKDETENSYTFRKELRSIIHVLHDLVNNNQEELRFKDCFNGNIECNNCSCYNCEVGCQECGDIDCMPEIIK